MYVQRSGEGYAAYTRAGVAVIILYVDDGSADLIWDFSLEEKADGMMRGSRFLGV